MKSKELMSDIKWDVLTSTILHKEEYLALCEEVEKDLEVLEILRKHLFINSWGEIAYDSKHHYQYINDEECKLFKPNEEDAKIKEWLENE